MTSINTQQLSLELNRGRLELHIQAAQLTAEQLFAFAERRNPKRAFLFVSKVLGRHIPVAPSQIRHAFRQLALQIPTDLPGPILVLGMAETAVGLAAGVHQEFSQQRPDSLYLATTRHPLGSELLARFEEEHSHASAHLIHWPVADDKRALLLAARSLVLVDDEASTGKTFINLLRALQQAGLSQIERVVTATLTDWSNNAVVRALGPMATQVSLLQGQWSWFDNPEAPLPEMPQVDRVSLGQWLPQIQRDWGRLGRCQHSDQLAPSLVAEPGQKILVLGTGEYVWPPFLLAERLERQGAQVSFSATTRSPIALGHAIKAACYFSDNYGLGIENFLYNVDPSAYDRILLCTEAQPELLDPRLLAYLQAEVVWDGQ